MSDSMDPTWWEELNSEKYSWQYWKARAEKAEKLWSLLKSKFPGATWVEEIEDLIEKEERDD